MAKEPLLRERDLLATTSDETRTGSSTFRLDIQGLRAVAVVLVILVHASVPGLEGGYVGVDVFFVISGFVITGVLLRQSERSIPRKLGHFYARRIRRIVPAATLTLIATVIAAISVSDERADRTTLRASTCDMAADMIRGAPNFLLPSLFV